MATRQLAHEIEVPVPPERVFALLHTPSAIRGWWGAARAVVIPRQGGLWAATWGADEDDPEYISVARLAVFEPPRRLVLKYEAYHARSGALPFDADFVTEFTVAATPAGTVLRVVQDGFPLDAVADGFYVACAQGWRDTFEGIRHYLGA